MLQDKLEESLRKQLALTGASALRITSNHGDLEALQCRAKLSARTDLVATFAQPERGDEVPSRRELLEKAARALRACLLAHNAESGESLEWPELEFPDGSHQTHDSQRLILARIQQFLKGLVDSGPMHQQVLLLRGRLIASAVPLEEVDEMQLDLLCRQLDNAGQAAPGTTHGELVRPGMYARSFWYGASLIGFASGDYAVDFVRHRAKMVARELANLLSMLDDGPTKPVKEAPP